ncbi:MAG: septum formation initiator family protein [Clostridia bacterium]|nr:septum formation initiator family protein [Clostridia bacterium]
MQKKRRYKVRPFRVLAVVLGAAALVMLAKFPAKAVSLERQRAQLDVASDAYYAAQSQNNQLRAELSEINTEDFIERTARREYSYCWYGETVYTVGNLADLQAEEEMEIYDGQQ